jgi:arylsulfatase A-like enzyme
MPEAGPGNSSSPNHTKLWYSEDSAMHFCSAICVLILLAASLSPEVISGERPNFLFILVDDQSAEDLKIYNPQSELDSPNISGLAERGMTIDGAYHMGSFSGAVCTPSRHMIMSGRTLWNLPIAPQGKRNCPPHLEQQTIAAVFNRGGYSTMRTCKMGNSYEAANRLFEVRRDATKRGGTAETGSAWHADQVLDYLLERERKKESKPFLIHFGFSHPHDTRDGTPELLAKYGATNHDDPNSLPKLHPSQPLLPPNTLPRHPFDTTDSGVRDEVAVSGVWKNRDVASLRNELGREFACSENIDTQIGRVLARLDAMGELNNTVVVYTADHGMSIGRHGLMGKQNLYQHTWRVPLIVAGPGIPKGSRAEGNVYLLDVLATLCDFAGIEPPETNQGLSFRSVLEGRQQTVREVMYGAYAGGSKPGIRCIRRGDWKLVTYDAPERNIHETQLFNLKENPAELLPEHHRPEVIALTGIKPAAHQTNLATDPQYSEKLREMRQLLREEMKRLNDPAAE